LRQKNGVWEVFLIQHRAGHWAMPKGHAENQETPIETATRELFEETNLAVVRLLFAQPFTEYYEFKNEGILIQKTVSYFVAEVSGVERLQQEELKDGKWVNLNQAEEFVTFSQAKNILSKVKKILIKS
jgi:bis(5'-nucleosidyl)-tetraphosphatase